MERRKIGLNSDLEELSKLIATDRKTGKIKKDVSSHLAVCMLGYLQRDQLNTHIPRTIKKVKDLYSFTNEEILKGFSYKKKTWLRLNEILEGYGLPKLNLPKEYTDYPKR